MLNNNKWTSVTHNPKPFPGWWFQSLKKDGKRQFNRYTRYFITPLRDSLKQSQNISKPSTSSRIRSHGSFHDLGKIHRCRSTADSKMIISTQFGHGAGTSQQSFRGHAAHVEAIAWWSSAQQFRDDVGDIPRFTVSDPQLWSVDHSCHVS